MDSWDYTRCYDYSNSKIKIMSKSVAVIGAGISGYGAAILANKKGYDVFVSFTNIFHG